MSDYRQQQELQERQEWLERLEDAIRKNQEGEAKVLTKQLQEYMNERLQETV